MIREAEAHADEAHKLRELAEARNHAETLLYATEKSLKEHRDKLDEADATAVDSRIEELRGVLEGDDAAAIRTKTQELEEASHKLAEAVYAQASAAQAASAPTGDGGSVSDDEVVEEADYEVIDEEEGARSS
jgi:molecular chaperone DnaK